MKVVRFTGSLVFTIALVFALNTKIGMLPPVGKFIDPVNGFWQNAEKPEPEISAELKLNVGYTSKVIYDERLVPHIFAENLHDLYFLQGYVTAVNRLWQMEFQTHAAAGRISEIIGEKAIPFDREQRRIGMLFSAENAVKVFETDTLSKQIMDAYSEGINAYINSLTEKTLPLEYKLLDYKPEEWTSLKSSLLLKFMAKMLTANERDFENTNMVNLIGKEKFDLLFPDFFPDTDPIIPRGTAFDSVSVQIDTGKVFTAGKQTTYEPIEKTDAHIGSNNWAVSGSKTQSGKPILCNDPHLKLSLPSIWYEIQLTAPDVNVYGVSLPGSPGIVIGFNDSVAWGVTNASVDVRDWYEITFKDDTKKQYQFNEKWLNTTARIEEIKVRGGKIFYDTVYYTHLGPVVYEDDFHSSGSQQQNLALKWTAHSPSDELATFYYLNRAKNYSDYEHALTFYQCPGQNFVYADAHNTIAIWQQGKFPARWKEQGKFIMDGSIKENEWQAYIPQKQNPHIKNPERGFVISANQHGVDETYPYYYLGMFEHYRNRRINNELTRMQKISADNMFRLQNDNYNLMAEENLPLMLEYAKRNELRNDSVEKLVLDALDKWNYMHDAEMIGPTAFDLWWKQYTTFVWDEFEDKPYKLIKPHPSAMLRFMKEFPNDKLFIHQTTKDRTPKNAVNLSYDAFYWTGLKINELITEDEHPQWGFQNAITVEHLARIPAFSFNNLVTGGYKYAVNAVSPPNGPSWRMVVELGDKPKAWGVYPGGQSGNPGSHNYTAFVEKWAKSEYYELVFMSKENQEKGKYIQQIIPVK
jgi:penicillin amidase